MPLPHTRKLRSLHAPLKIGVTLHPYYSWTANVVGKLPGYEVRALLPGDIDAGDYQPRPQDIKRLADLDVVIVNGIGHDDFIFPMLKASGNTRATIVRVNAETPMIRALRPGSGQAGANAVNSHTFISFSNAIQQTYAIQRALARLRPQDAPALQQNAADYARRLRTIKARAASQLADAKVTRVVTVHDGYGYLLQEFGLEVGGVVQPSHGLTPSAGELRDMVALLKREKITVVFSEATFPEPLLKVLRDEAGVSVYIISHIASGPFTADKFEREMQRQRRHDDSRAGEQEIGDRRNFWKQSLLSPKRSAARDLRPHTAARARGAAVRFLSQRRARHAPRHRRTERRRQDDAAVRDSRAYSVRRAHRGPLGRARPHRVRAAAIPGRSHAARHRRRFSGADAAAAPCLFRRVERHPHTHLAAARSRAA